MQKLFFRADGNSSIGLGHLLRLLAVADALKNNFEITFAVQNLTPYVNDLLQPYCNQVVSLQEETNFQKEAQYLCSKYISKDCIVVLDGYNFTTSYQSILKKTCKKLVYIDDLNSFHQVADVVINHAPLASNLQYDAEPYTQVCLGLSYALLRHEFIQQSSNRSIQSISKVMLSMGGADVHNVSLKFMKVLENIDSIKEVCLLLGKVNVHFEQIQAYVTSSKSKKFTLKSNLSAKQLCEELEANDLLICPASTTAIEACSVGIPIIGGYTADNQLEILNGLTQRECMYNLGDLTLVTEKQINSVLNEYIKHPLFADKMLNAQKKLIDGKSHERLLKLFTNLQHATL
jgi:UDP-2,4-diacetamido-2,4,6-trideoxy-beta-L-altropyranose hydrolase